MEGGQMATRLIDLIKSRRSIREYTGEPVAEAEVRQLLEAAMAAPSANNRQPWHFVIVRDDGAKAQLANTHRWSGMIARSALAIVVCGEKNRSHHWVEDTSAATENLLLAATALDLGAVWIGIHPDSEREDYVRDTLGIPEDIGVLCLIALGRPAERKPPRDSYDETRVHHDQW
jgi:nitroreductase